MAIEIKTIPVLHGEAALMSLKAGCVCVCVCVCSVCVV